MVFLYFANCLAFLCNRSCVWWNSFPDGPDSPDSPDSFVVKSRKSMNKIANKTTTEVPLAETK